MQERRKSIQYSNDCLRWYATRQNGQWGMCQLRQKCCAVALAWLNLLVNKKKQQRNGTNIMRKTRVCPAEPRASTSLFMSDKWSKRTKWRNRIFTYTKKNNLVTILLYIYAHARTHDALPCTLSARTTTVRSFQNAKTDRDHVELKAEKTKSKKKQWTKAAICWSAHWTDQRILREFNWIIYTVGSAKFPWSQCHEGLCHYKNACVSYVYCIEPFCNEIASLFYDAN